MASEPLVSVQITTYNHGLYIGRTIESVLNQRLGFRFEIVVGEDCSTDNTREIVLDFQRRYPDVVRTILPEKNVGAKVNFNQTMKACMGKYVALCDGDDYWHNPLKLQKQVDYMERHPECSMVHSSYDVYDEASGTLIQDYLGHKNFRVPMNPDISDVLLGCRENFRIQTCTVMVRRDKYQSTVEADPYLYATGPFLMGDVQLWAELSLLGRIGFMPESLATYRLLSESASRSKNTLRSVQFEVSQYDMALYLCDKHKLPADVRRNRELMWCNQSLRQAFHLGDTALAERASRLKGSLTLKDRAMILGAKSGAARRLLLTASRLGRTLAGQEQKIHA